MNSNKMDFSYGSYLAIIVFFGFASTAYHLSKQKKKSLRYTHKKQINDVIMFSEIPKSELIQSQFSRSLVHPSMHRLLSYLSLSQYSLDICMYMITNCDMAHLMQKLHNKGVKIRFIVDADMAYATGSATKRIEKQGIELRWLKSTNFMHNKFCIIDSSSDCIDKDVTPFVMIGSLNWTTQALMGNWEDVLITSKPTIVKGLKNEFERLWTQFKPIDKLQDREIIM